MPGQPYKTNRYSMHDKAIDNAVSAFNKNKAKYSGASPDQAKSIPRVNTTGVSPTATATLSVGGPTVGPPFIPLAATTGGQTRV